MDRCSPVLAMDSQDLRETMFTLFFYFSFLFLGVCEKINK